VPALALVLAAAGCNRQTPQAALPAWQPGDDLAEQLGEPSPVGRYLVHPPKGYAESPLEGVPPGAEAITWMGTARPDGAAPGFQVLVGSPPKGSPLPGLDEFLAQILRGVKFQRGDWSQSTPERGTVNGLTFLRTRWSGTHPRNGWKVHGITYVAIDGQRCIQLQAWDAEPLQEQALKIGEAAAQTFTKQ
jgi:hypothetical protein